jgi:hypothetical protein
VFRFLQEYLEQIRADSKTMPSLDMQEAAIDMDVLEVAEVIGKVDMTEKQTIACASEKNFENIAVAAAYAISMLGDTSVASKKLRLLLPCICALEEVAEKVWRTETFRAAT